MAKQAYTLEDLIKAAFEEEDHIIAARARVGKNGPIITFSVQILNVEDGETGSTLGTTIGEG